MASMAPTSGGQVRIFQTLRLRYAHVEAVSLGLRVRSCQIPTSPLLFCRLAVHARMASRKCLGILHHRRAHAESRLPFHPFVLRHGLAAIFTRHREHHAPPDRERVWGKVLIVLPEWVRPLSLRLLHCNHRSTLGEGTSR
jgi:hypothetical protein